MTLLKIYNLDDNDNVNPICTLLEGEHVLGRGNTLNVNDRRVSRKHAQLYVRGDGVSIKSVHVNPCFYKGCAGRNIQIIKKDECIELYDGDTFSLVADKYWYRVKITFEGNDAIIPNVPTESDESTSGLNTVSSLNVSKRCNGDVLEETCKRQKLVHEREASQNPQDLYQTSPSVQPDEVRAASPEDEVNLSITNADAPLSPNLYDGHVGINELLMLSSNNANSNILEDTHSSSSPKQSYINTKASKSPNANPILSTEVGSLNAAVIPDNMENLTSEDNEKNEEHSEKSIDSTPSMYGDIADETADIRDVEEAEVKQEIVEDISKREKCAAIKKEETSDKTDHNNLDVPSSSTNPNPTTSRRERCWYGANCYRKNPLHRTDFSHPGDQDYDSDPNDDRPPCPFGIICYRKNLEHRRQYKHSGRPAPQPSTNINNISGTSSEEENSGSDSDGRKTSRRKRRAAKKTLKYNDTPEDDYDYEDPFINDGSSDEFQLSEDDDDSTDWEDSQKADEGSEETKRLLKEAKKFTKKKNNKKAKRN